MVKGGKAAGTKKYKNDQLLKYVKKVKPISAYDWDKVCKRYQILSGEVDLRFRDHVKRSIFFQRCAIIIENQQAAQPFHLL